MTALSAEAFLQALNSLFPRQNVAPKSKARELKIPTIPLFSEHPASLAYLCIKKTFLCFRCYRKDLVELTRQDVLHFATCDNSTFLDENFDTEECIDNKAALHGWVIAKDSDTGKCRYALCPHCVEHDLNRLSRVADYVHGQNA